MKFIRSLFIIFFFFVCFNLFDSSFSSDLSFFFNLVSKFQFSFVNVGSSFFRKREKGVCETVFFSVFLLMNRKRRENKIEKCNIQRKCKKFEHFIFFFFLKHHHHYIKGETQIVFLCVFYFFNFSLCCFLILSLPATTPLEWKKTIESLERRH